MTTEQVLKDVLWAVRPVSLSIFATHALFGEGVRHGVGMALFSWLICFTVPGIKLYIRVWRSRSPHGWWREYSYLAFSYLFFMVQYKLGAVSLPLAFFYAIVGVALGVLMTSKIVDDDTSVSISRIDSDLFGSVDNGHDRSSMWCGDIVVNIGLLMFLLY